MVNSTFWALTKRICCFCDDLDLEVDWIQVLMSYFHDAVVVVLGSYVYTFDLVLLRRSSGGMDLTFGLHFEDVQRKRIHLYYHEISCLELVLLIVSYQIESLYFC